MPELATDPRFATPADRTQNRADLETIVRAWLLTRTKIEIAEAAQAMGVFAAPVLNVEEIDSLTENLRLMIFLDSQTLACVQASQTLFQLICNCIIH